MVYAQPQAHVEDRDFEVDSTESVWYINRFVGALCKTILKLTPQSQYGIW